ncbi:MAG: hypothetical protein GY827_06700 [Cytophagales bacterium]|nr:hypothetical protein [Cytophagales bacterium]
MKTRYIAVSLLASSLLFSQCNSFQQITLNGEVGDGVEVVDANAPTKGKSALTYNNGNLRKNSTWKVEENESISLQEENGVFQLRAKGTGIGEDNPAVMYADFPEGLDMRGGLAVRIKARSEGDVPPNLTFRMTDIDGNVANGKTLKAKVAVGDEFVTYYYELDGSFTQVFPTIEEVKSHLITNLAFVINEQDDLYQGSIFIDEIKVVMATEVITMKSGPVGKNGGVITNFSEGIKGWEASKGVTLSQEGSALKVAMENVGTKYQNISYEFESVNFKTNPKLKLRVRKKGNELPLFLRTDLCDINGSRTSYRPVIRKVAESVETVDLIFDYTGRFSQSYPEREVDGSRIEKIIIYLNPAYYLYTGTLYIESVEAIK